MGRSETGILLNPVVHHNVPPKMENWGCISPTFGQIHIHSHIVDLYIPASVPLCMHSGLFSLYPFK